MKYLPAALLAGLFGVLGPLSPASAQVTILDDPLHGQCFSGSTLCAEITNSGNNVTTIVGGNGFTGSDFGFTISPGPQGPDPFSIVIALPNNVTQPSSIGITGTINGTSVGNPSATPLSATWSSGDLDAVAAVAALFPNASPTNPFSNDIGFTQSVDPGATSYTLFTLSFGNRTLQDNSVANTVAGLQAAMDLSAASLPIGSVIVGFFDSPDKGWIATASSGTLFVDGKDAPPVPEPASLAALGTALMAFVGVRRRRWI